jgi:hypothetical protein
VKGLHTDLGADLVLPLSEEASLLLHRLAKQSHQWQPATLPSHGLSALQVPRTNQHESRWILITICTSAISDQYLKLNSNVRWIRIQLHNLQQVRPVQRMLAGPSYCLARMHALWMKGINLSFIRERHSTYCVILGRHHSIVRHTLQVCRTDFISRYVRYGSTGYRGKCEARGFVA